MNKLYKELDLIMDRHKNVLYRHKTIPTQNRLSVHIFREPCMKMSVSNHITSARSVHQKSR